MSIKANSVLYEPNEKPALWLTLVMGIQQVMLIYSEITLLPVIVGKQAGAPQEHILFASAAAAVAAGLITLIHAVRIGPIGAGYTLFMGTSAAYLAGSLATVKSGGFPLLATLSILVAPIEVLMAFFLRHLRHIITPVVGGAILMLVVISLVPVSVHEWVGESGHGAAAAPVNFLIGSSTMAILLGLSLFGNRMMRLWCPIIGLLGGVATSWVLGQINFQTLFAHPWLGRFPGEWPGLATDIQSGHLPLLAALGVLTFINGVQAIGNSMAVQQVSHRKPQQMDYESIQGTMYGDALGNVFSGLLGTLPNETYSENISVLRITGVASRVVGVCGALILILLPFCPKLSMALVQLPPPVFGGFLMGLAAMMMPAALELMFERGISHRTGLLVGISLCIGLVAQSKQFFPDLFPLWLQPILNSGVAAGGLTAVLLSFAFRAIERRGYTARATIGISRLHELISHLDKAGRQLDLSREQILRLQLACEEIFVHIAGTDATAEGKPLALRVTNQEEDLRVEMIYGKRLGSLEGFKMPKSLLKAEPSDLDGLGLALLSSVVQDFHQAVISGRTYIWFKLA